MRAAYAFFHQRPLVIFLVLVFGSFWAATPLVTISALLPGLVASLAPAIVAFALTALLNGRVGVQALASKLQFRGVGWRWYGAAVGMPVLASLLIRMSSMVLGAAPAPELSPLLAYVPIMFILAAGEEFGWRGFVLPRLLERFPILVVALLLGVIHAAYHLPLWVAPGFPAPSYSFLAFLLTSLAFGVSWTWLYRNTQGSVLIATLFHGAINSAGNLFLAGIEPGYLNWLMPLVFGAMAVGVIALSGASLQRTSMALAETRAY